MDNNMPLIAGTYKIISQMGSGGGGIVYLAEHLRLGKQVVLKADKRTLSAKPEVLRREVDALKNLNHTYIPQVYDFIEEDGTTYTVMDFIDGESFDKPLKRGERFSQAQVIEWACQLLDALVYLHSRPPHGVLHADIKPSNIMLTPQGDVCLIDFNIALALGEEGAVAVGRSFGYASPEHYGHDFLASNATRGMDTDAATDLSSNTLSDVGTILDHIPQPSSSNGAPGKKTIMLNVRSDIYSLGATLYHMMTGERPIQSATEVKPISHKDFSPAVIAIISKAMNPAQRLRWQSAEEMLYAFTHLRENDPRTKRHKRATAIIAAILTMLFLAGGSTIFAGQRLMEQEQRQLAEEAGILEEEQRQLAEEARILEEEQRKIAEEQRQLAQLNEAYALAEYSANSLRDGDVDTAISYAIQAYSNAPIAEAQKALTDALNVYDLSDGFKTHKTVELPLAPLYMEIAPDGKTAAAVYDNAIAVFNAGTAKIIATLPAERSALAEVKFINNSMIVYAGDGGIKAYDTVGGVELWTGKPATSISVSADSKYVAALYRNEDFATVYDAATGRIAHEVSFDGKFQRIAINDVFANPNDNLFALNHDGTMLGVSFADGSMWVYNLRDSDGDIELYDNTSGFTHFEGGFYQQFFAFSASKPSESLFAVIDTVELVQTGGFDSTNPFGVQADKSGIYVQTDNIVVKINPVTGEQTALVTTFEKVVRFARSSIHTLMTTKDEFMFFDANAKLITRHEKEYGSDFLQIADRTALIGSLDAPVIQIMKYESHPSAEVFFYDPSYRHDEARLSADGQTAMLFSYDGFRLFEMNGRIITEVSIPDANHLYDQQYRRDESGSRLEVIYNDGTIRAYSAIDGSILYEIIGEKPDLTLYEEFFTDTVRIESPLHGRPAAYNLVTGELIRELEKDAYLTYATQVGEYIITEYVTGDGFRYGLLLNSRCETLAYLPYLCDFVGDKLVFDYPTGDLRESRIYDINELIGLAR